MVWVGRQGAEETATWPWPESEGLKASRGVAARSTRVTNASSLQPEAALMLSNSPLIFDNVYWR
jgi:hypothetical protein